MNKNRKKTRNKTNIIFRFMGIIWVLLFISALIVVELVRTTVVLRDEWNQKAEALSNSEITINPKRGGIYADNGMALAADITIYDTYIDFRSEGFLEKTLLDTLPELCDSLAHFRPGKTADKWQSAIIAEMNKEKPRRTRSFRLFSQISDYEVKRLRTFPFLSLKRNQNGFGKAARPLRTKPFGSMAARSIGSVAEISVKGENDKNRLEYHGVTGLEKALDSLLYGKHGVAEEVQVTTGSVKVVKKPAIPGYDITTTINVALQDIVESELEKMCIETEAQWGTCVLMEVATGEIKAISNLEWSEKAGDYIEGVNHAVLGYEPGSTIKPISMMVALERGLVSDIDKPIPTGSRVIYEGRPISDPHGGAALTPRQIIETSSNIGMSKIITSGFSTDKGFAKDPGTFRDALEDMGFFERFNTGISGERVPSVARLGTKKADRVALTRMCYGYTTLIPPLHILAMYNSIANDGQYVRPHLVKKLSREGEPDSIVPVTYIRKQVCSPENANKLKIMLHDVVWGSRGTARNFVKDPDVEIAGKTGTCFVTEGGKYTTTRRLAFCGFFPYDKPQYSCIVVMKGANRGAAASSGTVLRNVARRMYARGWLGTKLKSDSVASPAPATIYASHSADYPKQISKNLGIKGANRFSEPKRTTNGGVPNVTGLNVREAIALLEDAGLMVQIEGSGYVASQSIAAGSKYKRGENILLRLRH